MDTLNKYFTSKRISDLGRMLTISITVTVLFLTYLYFIGIPKTTARNLYNEAVISIQNGDLTQAKKYLDQAYTTWPEPYIRQEIIALESIE